LEKGSVRGADSVYSAGAERAEEETRLSSGSPNSSRELTLFFTEASNLLEIRIAFRVCTGGFSSHA